MSARIIPFKRPARTGRALVCYEYEATYDAYWDLRTEVFELTGYDWKTKKYGSARLDDDAQRERCLTLIDSTFELLDWLLADIARGRAQGTVESAWSVDAESRLREAALRLSCLKAAIERQHAKLAPVIRPAQWHAQVAQSTPAGFDVEAWEQDWWARLDAVWESGEREPCPVCGKKFTNLGCLPRHVQRCAAKQ